IADLNRIDADARRNGGVVAADATLEDDGTLPPAPQIFDVAPSGGLIGTGEQGSPHAGVTGHRPGRNGAVQVGKGDRVIAQKAPRPPGVQCTFDDRSRPQGWRCREAVSIVALAM